MMLLATENASVTVGWWQQPLSWAVVLAGCGIWMLLPPADRWRRGGGAILSLIALGIFAAQVPPLAGLASRGVFWMLALVTLVSAVATISSRSPVYCAIWFALTLLGTSGLFLIQGSQFLALATVVVYAGAIVVTFLFVVMLAQPAGHAYYDRVSCGWRPALCASLTAAAMVGLLTMTLTELYGSADDATGDLRTAVVKAIEQPDAEQPLPLSGDQVLGVRLRRDGARRLALYLDVKSDPPLDAGQIQQVRAHLATRVLDRPPWEVDLQIRDTNVRDSHHVAHLGGYLFGRHLVAVEVAGTLLLVALVGAIVIVLHASESAVTEGAGHHG